VKILYIGLHVGVFLKVKMMTAHALGHVTCRHWVVAYSLCNFYGATATIKGRL